VRWPGGERTETRRRPVFSEECAPRVRVAGLTHAEAFHYTTWADRWPVARWRHASVNPTPSPRACGARPSAKWPSDAKNALRGQSRYDARGVFLGGARSPRPDCKVLLMPRHFITRAGWPGGRGLMETCLGQAPPFLTGVRSPPLRGVDHPRGEALRGKPWHHVGEIFSEGRTLRVRVVRTDASPGYGMITEERTNGQWPNREMLRSSASLSRGRAEPAPPRGETWVRGLSGKTRG